MARRLPRDRPLSRRGPVRDPNIQLVVVCEGRNTEPRYFEEFALEWGNRVVRLVVSGGVGVPASVVKRACEEKKLLETEAARTGDSFSKRFQVWAVFDIDAHPNIRHAKERARQAGVRIGVSNPCIELWAILHFKHQDGEIHRHDAQRELSRLMPTYDSKRSKSLNYDAMRPGYRVAVGRALQLLQRRREERNPGGNPSTTVHELLDVIVENGVIKRN